ncbi:hypothetical protein DdX_04644 [Ditylenchus destructor]|uniref:Transmembrane protein n=1 Tax=Ditylenchus destructor TaxID=166010 RepID=A0AAD4RB75_9BILA|nr:hypothetical protein DdX_04644 [Ditylenchus destructor]
MIPTSAPLHRKCPALAKSIECLCAICTAGCCLFVFLVAPITVITLVSIRIISPWWLFLGCGPLALLLCASACFLIYAWVTAMDESKKLNQEPANDSKPAHLKQFRGRIFSSQESSQV